MYMCTILLTILQLFIYYKSVFDSIFFHWITADSFFTIMKKKMAKHGYGYKNVTEG